MAKSFYENLIELLKADSCFVDDEDFGVSEEDRKLNRSFYGEAYDG